MNNSPPAGISSLNVTLSETLAEVALDANIAVLSAIHSDFVDREMSQQGYIPMARFRACDCLSIAPGVCGTQAIAVAVIDRVPGTFLKSASYRLMVDDSPDIPPRVQ